MNFIGIDLHTNRMTCCYRSEGSEQKLMASYGLDNEGIRSFLKTVDKESHILLEASITSFAFARLVTPWVKQLLIADTH